MQQPQHNAGRSPEGTASPNAVPWGEVRAARLASHPSGTQSAPLYRPPQSPPEQTRQTTTAHIEECFPGVRCWWGLHTHRWWAYVPVPQGDRLLEAASPNTLFTQVAWAARRPEEGSWATSR